MDSKDTGPPPDITEDGPRERVSTRWLPLASVDVKIADDGEILARGPSIMRVITITRRPRGKL
jgi:hypothetical protein